ncbi:hypothetical protein TcCL_Unassigned01403 [Trypanosoma cruzi]|nr:hypothetical protein TcCL_Unassigned01403 [Trypanosoma cruzi]
MRTGRSPSAASGFFPGLGGDVKAQRLQDAGTVLRSQRIFVSALARRGSRTSLKVCESQKKMPSLSGADVGRSCCRAHRTSHTVTAGTLCGPYTGSRTVEALFKAFFSENTALNNAASCRAVDKARMPSQSSVFDEGWSRNGLYLLFPNAIVSHFPFLALGHSSGRVENSGLEWSGYLSARSKKPASAGLSVTRLHAGQIWASVTLGKQINVGRCGRERSVMPGTVSATIRSSFRGTSGINLCALSQNWNAKITRTIAVPWVLKAVGGIPALERRHPLKAQQSNIYSPCTLSIWAGLPCGAATPVQQLPCRAMNSPAMTSTPLFLPPCLPK